MGNHDVTSSGLELPSTGELNMHRKKVTRTIVIEGPSEWVDDVLSKSFVGPSKFFSTNEGEKARSIHETGRETVITRIEKKAA
jgi:hypothetical protein